MTGQTNEEKYVVTNKEGIMVRVRLKNAALNIKNYSERKMGGNFYIIYDPSGVYQE